MVENNEIRESRVLMEAAHAVSARRQAVEGASALRNEIGLTAPRAPAYKQTQTPTG